MNGGNYHDNKEEGGEVTCTGKRRTVIPVTERSDIYPGPSGSGSGSRTDQLSSVYCSERPRKTAKISPSLSGRPDAAPAAVAAETDEVTPEKVGSPPKRPLSAYNFFYRDERAKLLADAEAKAGGKKPPPADGVPEPKGGNKGGGKRRRARPHGVISFNDLCSNMSQRWKKADAETRAKYKEMAARDSERYRRELDLYHRRQDAYLSALSDRAREEDAAAAAAAAPKATAPSKPLDGAGYEDPKSSQTPQMAGSILGGPDGKMRPYPREEPNLGSCARHIVRCDTDALRGVRTNGNGNAFCTSLSEIESCHILQENRTRLEEASREALRRCGWSKQDIQGTTNAAAKMEGAGALQHNLAAGSGILPPNRSYLLAPSLACHPMSLHLQGRTLSELNDYELLELYYARSRDGGPVDQANALRSQNSDIDTYRHLSGVDGGAIHPSLSHLGLASSVPARGLDSIIARSGMMDRQGGQGGHHVADRPFWDGRRPQENALDADPDGVAHPHLLLGSHAHSLGAPPMGRVDALQRLSSTDFSQTPVFEGGDSGRGVAPLSSSVMCAAPNLTMMSMADLYDRDVLRVQGATNGTFGIGDTPESAGPHAPTRSDAHKLR